MPRVFLSSGSVTITVEPLGISLMDVLKEGHDAVLALKSVTSQLSPVLSISTLASVLPHQQTRVNMQYMA